MENVFVCAFAYNRQRENQSKRRWSAAAEAKERKNSNHSAMKTKETLTRRAANKQPPKRAPCSLYALKTPAEASGVGGYVCACTCAHVGRGRARHPSSPHGCQHDPGGAGWACAGWRAGQCQERGRTCGGRWRAGPWCCGVPAECVRPRWHRKVWPQ